MSYLTNPYMVTTPAPPLDPIDFTVLSNWTQSPTGTVTWSSGIPNYCRTNTLLASGSDWEFRCDPVASSWGTEFTCGMGISLQTDTPDHLFKWNFCWFAQRDSNIGAWKQIGYWYTEPDGSNGSWNLGVYEEGVIYSIKCVSDVVSFYKGGALVRETSSAYDFDSSVNTMARFSCGQGEVPTVVVTCTGAS